MTPTLTEVLEAAIKNAIGKIRVAIPGVVKSYNKDKRTAEVIPAIQEYRTLENGVSRAETLPVISNVPVIMPGSGGSRIIWDVTPGDTVLLVFMSSSIDRWLAKGGVADPGIDRRRHDLSSAVAIPGLDAISNVSDAPQTIKFVDGQIQIGGADKLVTLAEFNNHKHDANGASPPSKLVGSGPFDGTEILRGG